MVRIIRISQFLFTFLFLGTLLAAALYIPYLKAYYRFMVNRKDKAEVTKGETGLSGFRSTIVTTDEKFGIVIPKIGVNSAVTPNVNPFNDYEYNDAFKKGIAHSRGSAIPGKGGNIVLIANAPGGFFDVQKYNLGFYFMDKLDVGDPIYIYYKSVQYKYLVESKGAMDVMSLNFIDLNTEPKYETLTLMTLWPPGTSFLRYVIEAERQKI